MADNIKGIPFSSDNEGVAYPDQAKALVVRYSELNYTKPLTTDEVYVVSFTYVLGNWKALLSTSRTDGHYYELTHNAAKNTTYIDLYVKIDNVEVERGTNV